MTEKNIKINSALFLQDIVGSIRKGEWKIPRFQREFVWEKTKVVDLLDSMYKEFPIGSFFLWLPPEDYARYYKDIPELQIRPDGRKFYTHFILDGQQRLTSLYVTSEGLQIDGFDYSSICFDLDTERFTVGPPDGERNISVHQIVNADKYLNIYNNLTDERKRVFMRTQERLNSYPFPVITIENKNIEEACKIFERINQGGKRLNIFDLVVALTWDKDFELKRAIDEFNKATEDTFGKIEYEVFSEAISLIIKKQCTKAFQLKLTANDVKENWPAVKKAIGLSIQFLRTNLRVPSYRYLPYRDIVALLAYYFRECEQNKVEVDKKFLEDWFWKVSFANRYSGSSFTKIGEDRAFIFDRKIRGESADVNYDINITEEKIKTLNMGRSTALRNTLLLILVQKTPLSFVDNAPVDIKDDPISEFNKSERHHIFPKAYLRSVGIKEQKATDLLANFCLIDSALNKVIRDKAPSEYFAMFQERNSELKEALDSHLIPEGHDSGVWDDDYAKFIGERSKLFLREIKKRIGDLSATIEEQMASGPEKLIQRTEHAIRETVNRILYDAYGEDWWEADGVVPQDVFQYAREKIKKEKVNKPYISDEEWETATRKLEQLNIMDYMKIIQKNWKLFEDIFGSRNNLEKYFEGFSTIRNQIDHIKTLDPTEVKFGETAVEWLLKCMREQQEKEVQDKQTVTLLSLNQIYEKLKTQILALDPEILEKKSRYFNDFNKKNNIFNFVRLKFRKKHLQVRVLIGREQLDEAKEIGFDISEHDDKEKNRIDIKVSTVADIDQAMRLIFLAYNFNENYILEKAKAMKPIHSIRLQFWEGLLWKAKERLPGFSNTSPSKHRWLGKKASKTGLSFNFVVHNEYSRVEAYLDNGDKEFNKKLYSHLQSHQQEIETSFGQVLAWEQLPYKRGSRISFQIPGGLNNKEQWEPISEELVNAMQRLEQAVLPYVPTIQ